MIASTFVTNLAAFLFFISLAAIGFIVIQPIFWNLPTQVLKGKGAAAAIALIGSLGNLGGFCRRKNKISIWKNKTSIKVEILFFYKP